MELFLTAPSICRCATNVIDNDRTPDWSYCCDVTNAKQKYFLMEVKRLFIYIYR